MYIPKQRQTQDIENKLTVARRGGRRKNSVVWVNR